MENRDKLTNRKSSGNYKKSGKEKLFRCKSSSIYTFVYVFSSRLSDMVTGIREIIITDWPRRSLQEVLEKHYQKPLEEIKCEETKEVDFGNPQGAEEW